MTASVIPKNFVARPGLPGRPRRLSSFESLRAMELFSPMKDRDLLEWAARGREGRVEPEGLVLPRDAAAPRLGVVIEGEALVSRGNGEGRELLIRTLEPGDFIGDIEVFDAPDERSRGMWVRAIGSVRVISWSREDTFQALRECPELALGFLGGMARQQRHLHRRVAGICHQRAPCRLARALSALLEDRGIRMKDAGGRRCLLLRSPPTQRRISEMAGMARETVSRLMSQWAHCGWIAESGGDLMVLDEGQLRRLAGG